MRTAEAESPDRFRIEWNAFSTWVSTLDHSDGKSSMWRDFIRDFPNMEGVDDRGLFRANQFRGYGFTLESQLPAGTARQRALLEGMYRTMDVLKRIRYRLGVKVLTGAGNAALEGTPYAMRELERQGLLDGYVAYCRERELAPWALNTAKLWYVAEQVLRSAPERFERVLEIGGGLGTLAGFLMHRSGVARYTIVDLPEMAAVAARCLNVLHPGIPIRFVYPGSEHNVAEPAPGVTWVTPDCVGQIADDSVDYAINIDSFQEMTEAQVTGYVQLAQRVVRDGGRFMNLNRRKRLGPEGYDNNPLTYPYFSSNRVLEWEIDPFFARTLNSFGARQDGWLRRVEEVRKR